MVSSADSGGFAGAVFVFDNGLLIGVGRATFDGVYQAAIYEHSNNR